LSLLRLAKGLNLSSTKVISAEKMTKLRKSLLMRSGSTT
jgi:hypothetical protein